MREMKIEYVFDVETNGLLNLVIKDTLFSIKDIDTEKVLSFRPNEVEVGLQLLSDAKLISHTMVLILIYQQSRKYIQSGLLKQKL